jgi:hypothetical protein
VPRAAPTCNNTSRLLADVTDFLLANAGSGRRRRARGSAATAAPS